MNKKNDKNSDFASATHGVDADIYELDRKYLDFIGGGVNSDSEAPIIKG